MGLGWVYATSNTMEALSMHRALGNILETGGIDGTLWIYKELQLNAQITTLGYHFISNDAAA